MEEPKPPENLTAAECASRTGLTVRALRVYEQFGLISPTRTAGGWRQYGSRDLVRLHTISILKAAGLSLLKISEIVRSSPNELHLKQVLRVQLGICKARRAEAERGLAIVEQMLDRLTTHDSLAVDELCAPLNSLQTGQSSPPSDASQETDETPIDSALLESYAGFYQVGDFGVWTIFRDGGKLLAQVDDRALFELQPTGEDEFELGGVGHGFRFVRDTRNTCAALVIHAQGTDITATRIDADTADRLRMKLAERVQAQKPIPGSEAVLRRLIDGVARNEPNYDEMTPALAYVTRTQLSQLHALSCALGAVRAMTFQGVGSHGWDVYDVEREHGSERYRIMLGSDGKISGASVVPLEAPVSLGP
jgi:DNA-binding transcriptional MerR regulator